MDEAASWNSRSVEADAAYTELHGIETCFSLVDEGPFSAIWAVEEEPKRKLLLYQIGVDLDRPNSNEDT